MSVVVSGVSTQHARMNLWRADLSGTYLRPHTEAPSMPAIAEPAKTPLRAAAEDGSTSETSTWSNGWEARTRLAGVPGCDVAGWHARTRPPESSRVKPKGPSPNVKSRVRAEDVNGGGDGNNCFVTCTAGAPGFTAPVRRSSVACVLPLSRKSPVADGEERAA